MTLTKEWLLKTIAELEEERDAVPGVVNEDAAMALPAMKIALASLEAKPLGYIDAEYAGLLQSGHIESCSVYAEPGEGCCPAYTAPPAPVSVPDEEQCKPHPVMAVKGELGFLDHFDRIISERDEDIDIDQLGSSNYEALMLAALDAFRAAMLQGADKTEPLHAVKATPLLNSSAKGIELQHADFQAKANGNSPDGWVACSERMPESNKYVLVCNVVWVGMGLYNDGEQFEDCERWQDEHGEFIDLLHHPVSHWMQLPETPQQEGE